MALMVMCDGCEAVIWGPVAALRVRKGSARGLGAYLSLVYSGRASARKMPLSGPKKTAGFPACVGGGGRIRAPKRTVFCVGFFLQSVA